MYVNLILLIHANILKIFFYISTLLSLQFKLKFKQTVYKDVIITNLVGCGLSKSPVETLKKKSRDKSSHDIRLCIFEEGTS